MEVHDVEDMANEDRQLMVPGTKYTLSEPVKAGKAVMWRTSAGMLSKIEDTYKHFVRVTGSTVAPVRY